MIVRHYGATYPRFLAVKIALKFKLVSIVHVMNIIAAIFIILFATMLLHAKAQIEY